MATAVPPGPVGSAPLDEHRRRGSERGRVLVLNATYEPINVCTVRRAVVLLLKSKAEVIERSDRELHSERMTMTPPAVIRPRGPPRRVDVARAAPTPPAQFRPRPAGRPPPKNPPPRRLRPRRLGLPV